MNSANGDHVRLRTGGDMMNGIGLLRGERSSAPGLGLQAEKARIPIARITLVKLPDTVPDDQAILVSDIFPTDWLKVELKPQAA